MFNDQHIIKKILETVIFFNYNNVFDLGNYMLESKKYYLFQKIENFRQKSKFLNYMLII